MEKLFILTVKNNDDGYNYCTLYFKTESDRDLAIEKIEGFNHDWYAVKDDDYRATHNYEVEFDAFMDKEVRNLTVNEYCSHKFIFVR